MKNFAYTRLGLILTASLALWCSTTVSHAATESTISSSANGKRPRICLVLSGGGARGAAHVGVIKVLEKYRVPIDCVAGTSMGSLVGGAYATGMSTSEMDKVLASISTELLFKDQPPRQERTMRSKQDDFTVLFSPELGVKDDGISVSKGLVSGVQLENVLRKLTKLSGYHNFDRLPIPYRAVATDLVTGKAVVFDKGDMASAMRASMSVPGAIAPAEVNGMMLVDGMLTNNLPVEIARDILGADIIIAVNVGTPLLKREQLTTILGVSGQMLSILTEQNVQASLAKLKSTDILISPELDEFTTGDFDVLSKISPRGEAAALKVAAQLEKLSLPPVQYAALRKQQMTDLPPNIRSFDEIRVVKTDAVNPASTLAVMETAAGAPFDQDKLDGDMRRIYGTGNFEHVGYKIVDEQSKRILVVNAVEKSWGPDYLRFGLGLVSDFKGEAYYNLLASYRKTWINSLGAEWRTDVQMGQNSYIHSELYQPLGTDSTRLFVLPYIDIGQRLQSVYRGADRIAQFNYRNTDAGLDIGSQFNRYGELRLGVISGELHPELRTGPTSLTPQADKIHTGGFKARLVLDQLDSTIFPRAGWSAHAKIYNSQRSLGADDVYTKWESSLNAIQSYGNHTFNFYGRVGGRMGNEYIPTHDVFQWGGFLQQSGYAIGQLAGQDITFGRMMYYHRIMRSSLLEGAYAGFSLEAGKIGRPTQPQGPEGVLKSASVFIGVDSPVGPAYLAYGHAASGQSSMYFFLGRPY